MWIMITDVQDSGGPAAGGIPRLMGFGGGDGDEADHGQAENSERIPEPV